MKKMLLRIISFILIAFSISVLIIIVSTIGKLNIWTCRYGEYPPITDLYYLCSEIFGFTLKLPTIFLLVIFLVISAYLIYNSHKTALRTFITRLLITLGIFYVLSLSLLLYYNSWKSRCKAFPVTDDPADKDDLAYRLEIKCPSWYNPFGWNNFNKKYLDFFASQGTVRGKVTDSRGNPIENVSVSVDEATGFFPELDIFTDKNGKFQFNLGQGTFTISTYSEDYFPQDKKITIIPGQTYKLNFEISKILTSQGFEELSGNINIHVFEKLISQSAKTSKQEQKNIAVKLSTEKEYGCLDYRINAIHRQLEKQINIELLNIINPLGQHCSTAMGPAEFMLDLGKPEGNYRLTIKHKNLEDVYDLSVNDFYISVNPVSISFTQLTEEKIVRFPSNSILLWCGPNQGDLCNRFSDELTSLGAVKSKNNEYFNYLNQKSNSEETNIEIYNYDGENSMLSELIKKYSSTGINNISIHTWDGEYYSTSQEATAY